MHIQTIKEEIRKLTRTEQVDLIHFMISLLASGDLELSEEWKAEIDRREEALDKGTSIGKSTRDVITKYTSH